MHIIIMPPSRLTATVIKTRVIAKKTNLLLKLLILNFNSVSNNFFFYILLLLFKVYLFGNFLNTL